MDGGVVCRLTDGHKFMSFHGGQAAARLQMVIGTPHDCWKLKKTDGQAHYLSLLHTQIAKGSSPLKRASPNQKELSSFSS